jgi:hypothetical protein
LHNKGPIATEEPPAVDKSCVGQVMKLFI